jgi:hypothetical protein
MIESEGVSLHFIWARDYESVARHGLLCHYLMCRIGVSSSNAYKAQRQLGADLLSIWDPWSFLHRHWRYHPTGSENRPWEIIEEDIDTHFRTRVDRDLARSLRSENEKEWIGLSAPWDRVLRRRLDHVRRRIAALVRLDGPAPGVNASSVRSWIRSAVTQMAERSESSEPEICIVLSPQLRRYDFPGYKHYENFVLGRVHPSLIRGVVLPRVLASNHGLLSVAERYGHSVAIAGNQ